MTACDKPNWRAIAKGFTPALNAARTALAFPEGMPAGGLGFCGRGPRVRTDVGCGGDFLRREASPCTAVRRRSNSVALRILSDASRSDGKRGRTGGLAAAGASNRTGSSIAGPLKRSGEASPRLRAGVTIGQRRSREVDQTLTNRLAFYHIGVRPVARETFGHHELRTVGAMKILDPLSGNEVDLHLTPSVRVPQDEVRSAPFLQ